MQALIGGSQIDGRCRSKPPSLESIDFRGSRCWFDPDKQTERRTIVGPFEFDVVGTRSLPPTTADSVRRPRRRLAVYSVPIGSFRTQRTLGGLVGASGLARRGVDVVGDGVVASAFG